MAGSEKARSRSVLKMRHAYTTDIFRCDREDRADGQQPLRPETGRQARPGNRECDLGGHWPLQGFRCRPEHQRHDDPGPGSAARQRPVQTDLHAGDPLPELLRHHRRHLAGSLLRSGGKREGRRASEDYVARAAGQSALPPARSVIMERGSKVPARRRARQPCSGECPSLLPADPARGHRGVQSGPVQLPVEPRQSGSPDNPRHARGHECHDQPSSGRFSSPATTNLG